MPPPPPPLSDLAGVSASPSLASRSYLGMLLPESLIYVLDSHGATAFACALVADNDTPELIWTHSMRMGRLLPQIMQVAGRAV